MERKTYLGDSVYATLQHGGVLLTTENCLPTDPSNSIFLEPEVLSTLMKLFAYLTGAPTTLEEHEV